MTTAIKTKAATRCTAWVAVRPYSKPGQCEIRRDVLLVRWAPTPLKTRVMHLCPRHRLLLEAGRKVETIKDHVHE